MLIELAELNFGFSKAHPIRQVGKVRTGDKRENSQGWKFFCKTKGTKAKLCIFSYKNHSDGSR